VYVLAFGFCVSIGSCLRVEPFAGELLMFFSSNHLYFILAEG